MTRRDFLAAGAAVPLALQGAAPGLLDVPRIGAQFFLNRDETREGVRAHLRNMADTGLTVVRIFTIWDHVEPEQGRWDFTRYDWIYDAAAESGLLVANTLCAEDPPGWMRIAPLYHAWHDLSDPRLHPHSERYIEQVVKRYRSHRAHGVWLLQNEPGIAGDPAAPYAVAAFARWVEKKYGTIEALHRAWYRKYPSFAEVEPAETRQGSWIDYEQALDWREFRCDHLANQLAWIRAEIEKHHPKALTHINPPGQTVNMPASGRDMWRLKRHADFMGASMHASWHFSIFPRNDFGMAYAFCCDLVRSVSAPAPWWVTELQGGPTVMSGSRPLNPMSGEITRWLWDGVGNGARGIVFWLWHPRNEGNEAGEWGLAGPRGEPTERTHATKEVARVLREHGSFFAAAKPVASRVAILYNSEAMLLHSLDRVHRPNNAIVDALMGCYKALHTAHVPVDFVDSSELGTALSRYRVLYLPYAYALSRRSAEAIREFVRAGGTVWADALVGWKDERGRTGDLPPGLLADVFNFTVEDIQPVWGPFSLESARDQAGELWRTFIPEGRAQVLIRDPEGKPAIVERAFGKGRAIYCQTLPELAYLRREDPRVAAWIAAPAVEASRDLPVRLLAAPEGVSFRGMQAADGRWGAVLNGWRGEGEVQIAHPGGEMRFRLAAGGTAVVIGGRRVV